MTYSTSLLLSTVVVGVALSFILWRKYYSRKVPTGAGLWFHDLFGFCESSYSGTKKNLLLENKEILSLPLNKRFPVGDFSTPSLAFLRSVTQDIPKSSKTLLNIRHIAVKDIYQTHQTQAYKGAMFQVASQFNCLEFASPNVIPEHGITTYASDLTQGPACSLACPAATLYRNYFATTPKGNQGQTKYDQINNLDDLEAKIDNHKNKYWLSRNGYTNSTPKQLAKFNQSLREGKWAREDLIKLVKIGLHLDTEVIRTFEDQSRVHEVNQAFCSAISVAYSDAKQSDWEEIAKIVLDSVYESTLLAALMNSQRDNGSNIVILTFIGGGVFGNNFLWIIKSIARACAILRHYHLEVHVAHYRRVCPETQDLIQFEYEKYVKELENAQET